MTQALERATDHSEAPPGRAVEHPHQLASLANAVTDHAVSRPAGRPTPTRRPRPSPQPAAVATLAEAPTAPPTRRSPKHRSPQRGLLRRPQPAPSPTPRHLCTPGPLGRVGWAAPGGAHRARPASRITVTAWNAPAHPDQQPAVEAVASRWVSGRRRAVRGLLYAVLALAVATVCIVKVYTVEVLWNQPLLLAYGIAVVVYIFSRFVLSWLYVPRPPPLAETDLPSVALIVPAYNEEAEIAATVNACLDVDYPAHLLRVVVVDDHSTDGTLARLQEVAAGRPQVIVRSLPTNQGKRHAMAAGFAEAGDAEMLIFIDSDSRIEPASVRNMMRYFADEKVGAVTGHTEVMNRYTNILTKMQVVRYFIAFRVYKSAEALFGSVTCCSGCFSAYRRSAVEPVIDEWMNQTFLGTKATFGDDRSLTNLMLRTSKVMFAPDAYAHTNVPDDIKTFLRQQLRWKKSWARESLRASTFMWRKNPIMSISFYLGFILPLLGPVVVGRVLYHLAQLRGAAPLWFIGGVIGMALIYGLHFRVHRRERIWAYSMLFSFLYAAVFVWQMPYALLTIRNGKWGTR